MKGLCFIGFIGRYADILITSYNVKVDTSLMQSIFLVNKIYILLSRLLYYDVIRGLSEERSSIKKNFIDFPSKPFIIFRIML